MHKQAGRLLTLEGHLFTEPLAVYKCGRSQPPGGHCLFEGRYPLPNYRPHFSALSAPQSFLPPPIFEGHRPPPLKVKHYQYKIIYKRSSTQLSIEGMPCIIVTVYTKSCLEIEGIQT